MQLTPRRKSARPPAPPRVERLEDRVVPAITPTWTVATGTLSIVATNNEPLIITAAGDVFVNGTVDTGAPAASVQTLDLSDTGAGPSGSTFDVSHVSHAGFGALTHIQVIGNGNGSTLIAPNLSLTWDIEGTNTGDLAGMTAPLHFVSVGNLHGGTVADDFAFSDTGSLGGNITGGSGSETLDFSSCNGPVAAALIAGSASGFSGTASGFLGGTFSGMDSLIGGNGTSTLTGEPVAASTWSLSSNMTYSDGSFTLPFSSFTTLKGGAGQNTFDLLFDLHDLGVVTADLYGGAGNNTFSFQGGTDLDGTIYGGLGVNTLDYTQYGAGTSVMLTGYDTIGYDGTHNSTTFNDINVINTTSGLGSTLTGDNTFSTWSLAAGTYNDGDPNLTFTGFDGLIGGDGGNLFNIDANATFNLTGGAGDDTFAMLPTFALTGSITGGSGTSTISYATYTTSVNVNLTTGVAPNVSGTVSVNNVIGGSGNDTLTGGSGNNTLFAGTGHDSLIGGTGNETYSLMPGGNSSDVIQPNGSTNTLSFSRSSHAVTIDIASRGVQTVCAGGTVQVQGAIQEFDASNYGDTFKITANTTANLVGGPGADTFVFTPGATLTGSIDGGAGHNTLNYSAYTTPVHVNLAAGTATAVTGSVTNVDDAIGGSASGNVLIGDEVTSVMFNTTTPRTGDVLTATVNVTDLNNDPITVTYVWKVNGVTAKTTTGTASLTDTLALPYPGAGAKGSVITLTVTPFDTHLNGAPASAQPATVQDSPPFITSVSISPTRPVPGQVLTAVVSALDPDGRRVTLSYVWLHNGMPIIGATGPTLNLAQYGYGVVGDTVTVRVTPSDGVQTGTTVPASTPLYASPAATYVIGTNHEIYGVQIGSNGLPTGGYYLVSSMLARSVASDTDGLGRTELFVLGMDDQVYAMHLDGNGVAMTDSFGSSTFLVVAGQVKAISATRTAAGNPEIFVIGTDNQVRGAVLSAPGYPNGGYFMTAAAAVTGISATQDASGNPLVFVIGSGSQVYAEDFDATGRTSHGYFLVASGQVRAIKAGLDVNGHPLLMAIETDGKVYGHLLTNGGAGSGSWYVVQSGPAVSLNWCTTSSGNVDLFVLGGDGQMQVQRLTATGQPNSDSVREVAGLINDLVNDGNLTGLTPLSVDLYFALTAPMAPTMTTTAATSGRRNGS
jgi:hypothetical protein